MRMADRQALQALGCRPLSTRSRDFFQAGRCDDWFVASVPLRSDGNGLAFRMHEMSVAMSLLELAEEVAHGQGCARLERVCVEYGALAGIMPEALEFCFEALTRGTAHEDVRLELICLPLRLRCVFCGAVFGGEGQDARWEPCPGCGEVAGHVVEQGKELLLREVEAS